MPPRDSQPPPPTSNPRQANVSPHSSSSPLITDSQRKDLQDAVTSESNESKSLKSRLLGLGKKKDDKQQQQKMEAVNAPLSEPAATAAGISASSSQLKKGQHPELKPAPQPIAASPSRLPHQHAIAASSNRMRSSSPRLHSPASSEIFERSVQEPIPISNLQGELSPAHIPTHVITEDSIPPALEASAQAITSENLNPDDVEIVMSATHQPAAATLEGGSASHADLTGLHSLAPIPPLRQESSTESEVAASLHQSGFIPGVDDDTASNYGQLDPTDVRRLSFISFKDIVHSEHAHGLAGSSLGEIGSRDSLHISNLPASSIGERAASPLRSPRSPSSTHSKTLSAGLATPPPGTNVTNPILSSNAEQSPVRSMPGVGSPGSQHGELTIETMRQSIRKTASGDLSGVRHGSDGVRSAGMSPVSDDKTEGVMPPRSRTNS